MNKGIKVLQRWLDEDAKRIKKLEKKLKRAKDDHREVAASIGYIHFGHMELHKPIPPPPDFEEEVSIAEEQWVDESHDEVPDQFREAPPLLVGETRLYHGPVDGLGDYLSITRMDTIYRALEVGEYPPPHPACYQRDPDGGQSNTTVVVIGKGCPKYLQVIEDPTEDELGYYLWLQDHHVEGVRPVYLGSPNRMMVGGNIGVSLTCLRFPRNLLSWASCLDEYRKGIRNKILG